MRPLRILATELIHRVNNWGMTVSTEKTKGMVVGADVDKNDAALLQIENSSIETMANTFLYLGCNISEVHIIASRIAKASRALDVLRKPIFQNVTLQRELSMVLLQRLCQYSFWNRNVDHQSSTCEVNVTEILS